MSCQLLVEVSNLVIRLDLVAITPHLSSRGTYVAMHESARSFVCSIGRTTLDIRLAHARFPSAADTSPPRSSASCCFVLRASPRPPPRRSPPTYRSSGRAARQACYLFFWGVRGGAPWCFFSEKKSVSGPDMFCPDMFTCFFAHTFSKN